ncbi:MAG: GTP-binding protein, partial [Bacteroidota bacterium]
MGMFDITGGILTAVGVLFAGFSTRSKRKKIVDGFEQEVQRGRDRLTGEVTNTLRTYIQQLKQRIDNNFLRLDEHLQREGQALERLRTQYQEIEQRLIGVEAALPK